MIGARRLRKFVDKDNVVIVIVLVSMTLIYVSLSETAYETNVIKCTCKETMITGRKETIITGSLILQNPTNTTSQTTTKKYIVISTKTLEIKNNLKKKIAKRTKTPEVKLINFTYPLNIDMVQLVKDVKKQKTFFYKPINVYKYKLVKNCPSICKVGIHKNRKLLLFAIKSAAANFNRRTIIRETWGKEVTINGFIIKRVFILGLSNRRKSEENITIEYKKFGDLIQYNFDDGYFNNTLKTIGTFNWIATYCKQMSFVLFVDDDYFVSPQNLVIALRNLTNVQVRKLYMGHVWNLPIPIRNPKRKWYVSRSEYPFNRYPSFINAGSYVMSIQTVIDVQIAIQYTQFFRLDDVYLGIVTYKLHIEPLNHKEFRVMQIPITKEAIETVITSHDFGNLTELTKAWRIHTRIIKSRLK